MSNASSINPNDFEYTIFELISEGNDFNSNFLNHQIAKLYEKYKPMAVKLSRKYHLDSDLADDVLQEGIALLINRIYTSGFEYNPELGFKSFLFRTFQNLAANINKKLKNFPTREFGYLTEVDRDDQYFYEAYNEAVEDIELEERVVELLEQNLGESAASVLYISLIENKTNAEGAKIMKYKNEAVFRKKKSQHLKNLRERITRQQERELLRMAG